MLCNPFLLHPQQLQQQWKDLRKSISCDISDIEKLQQVVDFWKLAPISSPYLDYLNVHTWPDAWSLVDFKLLDINTVALGMFYTLLFSNDRVWTTDRLVLALIKNERESWERLVCIVDGSWLLNYDCDRVVDAKNYTDMFFMHMYKYNLHKRCLYEINK